MCMDSLSTFKKYTSARFILVEKSTFLWVIVNMCCMRRFILACQEFVKSWKATHLHICITELASFHYQQLRPEIFHLVCCAVLIKAPRAREEKH